MGPLRLLAAAGLLAGAVGASAETPAAGGEEFTKPINLWPLLYEEKGPTRHEVEVLFSLLYYERDRDKLSIAFRPFYSRTTDLANESMDWSFLWPLARYSRVKDVRKLDILPLYWQRLSTPESYSIFFPFYSYRRDLHERKTGVIGYSPISLLDFRKNYDTGRIQDRILILTYERQGPVTSMHILPLYSQDSSPDRGSSALFPLYAYAWSKTDDYMRFSMIGFPDYINLFEVRREDRTPLREWHLLNMMSRRQGNETVRWFAPFYWRFDTASQDSLYLWPFYGISRRGDFVERSVIWPFFRYGSGLTRSDLNLFWPLERRLREPGFSHDRFFPLFAVSRSSEAKEASAWAPFALFAPVPLLYRTTGADFSYNRFIWLAWLTRKEEMERDVVLTYYNFEDHKSGDLNRGVFPLWHESRWEGRRLDLVAPLWASYSRPGFEFRTLFPFYWRYASEGVDLEAGIPFYLRYRSPGYEFKTIFPFYYKTRDPSIDSELEYFFPFYGTYRRGDYERDHFLFFPLWSKLEDEKLGMRSYDLLWPFFHYETSPTRSSVRALPLYWQTRSPEGEFAMGFPLYWHVAGAWGHHTHLFPFYGEYAKGDFSLEYVLGPVYVRTRDAQYDRIDVLGSLVSYRRYGDRSASHILPLFWSEAGPEGSRLRLIPLAGFQSASPSFRSAYLVGFSRDASLFEWTSDPEVGLGRVRALNFYAKWDRASSFATFFPLYWSWSDSVSSGSLLFPLFSRNRSKAEGRSNLSILGLPEGLSLVEFSENRETDRDSQRLLLYYHHRNGDRHLLTLFPLYWRWWDAGQARSVLFPLASTRRTSDERAFGLLGVSPDWSLFEVSRSSDSRSQRFFPLYGYRREGEDRGFSALGVYHKISLFYAEKSSDTFHARLLPVFDYERHGAPGAPDGKVTGNLLWRVVYYDRDGPSTDFRVLFRLIRVSSRPEGSAFEFNPFYFRVAEKGASYWAVLGGLYGMETRADGTRKTHFLWVF